MIGVALLQPDLADRLTREPRGEQIHVRRHVPDVRGQVAHVRHTRVLPPEHDARGEIHLGVPQRPMLVRKQQTPTQPVVTAAQVPGGDHATVRSSSQQLLISPVSAISTCTI